MEQVSFDILGGQIRDLGDTLKRIERKLDQVATREHLVRHWRLVENRAEFGRDEMLDAAAALAGRVEALEARVAALEAKP